jgi:DNA repair exonuclease SbcCD ATPase subunit
MEPEMNDQREAVREELRARIAAEMESKINFEKERNARIEREYATERAKFQEQHGELEQRLEKARNEAEIARRELAIRTMKAESENSQLGERLGAMKEEAKALRVELEKADEREAEIDRLNREIKELRAKHEARLDAMTREYAAAKDAFQEREISNQEQILELQDELARFQDVESAKAANKSSLDLLERFRRRFQE